MLSKMINLTNAAGCAGPELLGLQDRSQPSFEMRGSFLGKPLEQLPNPIQPPSYLAVLRSTTRQDPLFRATIGEEKTPRAENTRIDMQLRAIDKGFMCSKDAQVGRACLRVWEYQQP